MLQLHGITRWDKLASGEHRPTLREHLKGLEQLGMLLVQGTKVTNAGVKEFPKALPNCKIYR